MKILQIIDTLDIGGAERILVNITNLLFKRGVDVSVLTTVINGPMAEDLNPNIKINSIKRKRKYSILSMYHLSCYVKNYDILHVHLWHNLKYVLFIKKMFQLKNAIIFHDHFGGKYNDYFFKFFKNDFYYIGVNNELCNKAELAGIERKKISLLKNFVDIDIKGLKSRNEINKVILISNFHIIKNIEFAVRLINEYLKIDNIQLDIYGHIHNQAYYNKIVEIIKSAGLSNSINIITDCKNITEVLLNYDYGLHVSKYETGPLVLLEYIMTRIPFLTYNTGDVAKEVSSVIPEFVNDNFDIKNWVERLQFGLSNKTLLRERMDGLNDFELLKDECYHKCQKVYTIIKNSL